MIDACELADGSGEDCDDNGQLDSCEIAAGTAADLDRDGVVDACQAFLVFEVPSRFDGIAKAIGLAPAGSVISVAAGTYHEAVDGSSLMAVTMLSATEHHAGGKLAEGVSLHTVDGGATYTATGKSIKGQQITDMSFISPTHGYATAVNFLQICSLLEFGSA